MGCVGDGGGNLAGCWMHRGRRDKHANKLITGCRGASRDISDALHLGSSAVLMSWPSFVKAKGLRTPRSEHSSAPHPLAMAWISQIVTLFGVLLLAHAYVSHRPGGIWIAVQPNIHSLIHDVVGIPRASLPRFNHIGSWQSRGRSKRPESHYL
jgi:hypothetical protein